MEYPDKDKMYSMALHELIEVAKGVAVMRVPGGWIYFTWIAGRNDVENTTFVPFHNEFI